MKHARRRAGRPCACDVVDTGQQEEAREMAKEDSVVAAAPVAPLALLRNIDESVLSSMVPSGFPLPWSPLLLL